MAAPQDSNDGKPWSDMDIFDLRAAIENGDSVEDIARFLCRAGSIDEVAAKARGLGLGGAARD